MCKPVVLMLMALPLVVAPAQVRSIDMSRFPELLNPVVTQPSVLLATRDQQTQECRWLGTCVRR